VDWTAVALVGVTGAVTLGAVFLQNTLSRGEARRAERKEHQREGRDIVVELAMMVRESDHIRYVMNTNEAMRAELIERRQALRPLEKRILLWAGDDEDETMANRVAELVAAVDRAIYTTALVVSQILDTHGPQWKRS
jgi:low affinity Fe/Cu permease